MIPKFNSHRDMDQQFYDYSIMQPFPQHHYNSAGDVIAIMLIVQGVYNAYQKWKMQRRIKKYLKIVVELSNLIQDEKNILQDMRSANIPYRDQYIYVRSLCVKQDQAIRDLVRVELEYPGEIHNRFFYFRDKSIF